MLFTLIGMPGSGKTCMSRAMAGKMNIKILDADRVIEARVGKKLQEIISDVGVEEFKRIEESILLTIDEKDAILATGGSAVYYDSAMRHFKSLGKVIYLYVSFETMIERLGDYSARGIVIRPGQTIKDLYEERAALYEKYADITINCDGTAYAKYRQELVDIITEEMNKANA